MTGDPSTSPHVLDTALAALAVERQDSKAWEQLYTHLRPWVLAMMYRGLNGQRALAEEATQDVFFKLHRHARFSSDLAAAQFRRFVRIVASGVLADLLRVQAREQRLGFARVFASPKDLSDSVADPNPSPESNQISHSMLDNLLANLSGRDRVVAELILHLGASPREVASATGYDISAVYEVIARIKRIARRETTKT